MTVSCEITLFVTVEKWTLSGLPLLPPLPSHEALGSVERYIRYLVLLYVITSLVTNEAILSTWFAT